MITLTDYWMGRDATHPTAMTPTIDKNARVTVDLANSLCSLAKKAGVPLVASPRTGNLVSSGWRPPAINAGVAGAAPNSKHMTGEAIDLYDPDGDLDEWLMTAPGQSVLKDLGLWMEHPSATKGWCHLQTRPPRSGNRVFYP